jgi:hypothetical protein
VRLRTLPNVWLVSALHFSSLMRPGFGAKPDEYMRLARGMSIRSPSACREPVGMVPPRGVVRACSERTGVPFAHSCWSEPCLGEAENDFRICGYCGKRRTHACGTCGQHHLRRCPSTGPLLSSAAPNEPDLHPRATLILAVRHLIDTVSRRMAGFDSASATERACRLSGERRRFCRQSRLSTMQHTQGSCFHRAMESVASERLRRAAKLGRGTHPVKDVFPGCGKLCGKRRKGHVQGVNGC